MAMHIPITHEAEMRFAAKTTKRGCRVGVMDGLPSMEPVSSSTCEAHELRQMDASHRAREARVSAAANHHDFGGEESKPHHHRSKPLHASLRLGFLPAIDPACLVGPWRSRGM
jgi:hypothetical protein